MDFLNKYASQILGITRIVAGLCFLEHGTAKVLGESFAGDWKNGCFVKGARVVAIGVERSSCAGLAAELEHPRTF